MHEALVEVGRVAEAEGIDIHYARGGTVSLARNEAQLIRARELVEEERRADRRRGAARAALEGGGGGGGARHPRARRDLHAALRGGPPAAARARARASCVEARGVSIFERTTATEIQHGAVVTDHGSVRAEIVVRATEGYTASLRGQRRRFVPLYSLMIATEPLSAEAWDEIGLRRRETFADLRHMRIYGQRTADDRFAFGGRGAPYHFGSRTRPAFDRDGRVHSALREVLVDLFPVVRDYEVTHQLGRRARRAARLARVGGPRPSARPRLGGRLRGRRRGHVEPRRPHARPADRGRGERADAAAVGRPPLARLGAGAAPLARRERAAGCC